MTDSMEAGPDTQPDLAEFELLCVHPMRALERKLASGVDRLSADEITSALIANSVEPVPPTVLAHIRTRLAETNRIRKGRPSSAEKNPLKVELIYHLFMRKKDWLTARKKSQGLKGWKQIRDADWWKGPPAERAARMVLRRLELNMTWESVQKLAYSTDKQRRTA